MSNFLLDPQLYLYGRVKQPSLSSQDVVADKATYSASCATPNATIHYTTNGADPTENSTTLTGDINLTHGTVIKVIATRSGFRPSPITTDTAIVVPRDPSATNDSNGVLTLTDTNINTRVGETVELQYKKANGNWTTYDASNKPSFINGDIIFTRSLRAGKVSAGTYNITISLFTQVPTFDLTRSNDYQGTLAISGEEGATTYYRFDPTSTWLTYTKALSVTQGQTVYAYSTRLGKDSEIVSTVTNFVPNTPTVSINSVSGAVTITDNSTSSYPSSLYYQVNSTTGSWIAYIGSLTATDGQRIYVKAVRQGLSSASASALCEIEAIAKPSISIDSSTGNTTLACTTTLVSIYYTTDGSIPTTSSTKYTSVIPGLTHGTVVTARAYKLGKYSESATATVSITLAAPTITKSSESVDNQTASVTLSCATSGAKIYYTTDGTAPSASSTEYTAAFTVNHSTTVKAISIKLGNSKTAQNTIYVTPKKPTISISSADGTVTITNNNTTGSLLYGTSSSSITTAYTAPFTVDHGTTVYTVCTRSGLTSATSSAICNIALATPVIEYNANTGVGTITCTTDGAELHFTTNNTDPKNGAVPGATEQFTHGEVVRAIAYKKGRWSSEATPVTVSINLNAPAISIATVSTSAGTGTATISVADTSGKEIAIEYKLDNGAWTAYSKAVSVTWDQTIYARATKLGRTTTSNVVVGSKIALSAPSVSINDSGIVTITKINTGAKVYYTTDGINPTDKSTEWTSGTFSVNHGTVVKVIEYRSTLTSTVASATCSISLAAATITYADNSIPNQTATVTITCTTADSTIYYTTDGTAPTVNSTKYTGTFNVSHGTTVKAFTVKKGKTTTAVEKAIYVTPKAPSVSISSSTGVVTLSDNNSNEAADIYYTTDGTNPSKSSTKWTSGTFDVLHSTDVKVIAFRHNIYSSITTSTCSITLATPTITLSLLSTVNGTMTATVNNTTTGATYYYVVGDSPANPDTSSSVYNASSKPSVYHGRYIKVKGYKLGNETTVVTSAQASVTPAAPTISTNLADEVTMSHANTDTSAVSIRYTKGDNGADPADPTATTGTVYSKKITSTENTRFDAITVRTNNGLTVISSVSTGTVPTTTYSITKTAEDVAAQTGTYKLTSSLAVDRIYYTTNGTTPTTSSSYVANNGTITGVACDTVIKIKGYLNNVLDDEVKSATAYITPKAPTISWNSAYNNNFTVTDNTSADASAIYVTIDGTVPSASNTTTARTISSASGTVKAVAVRHGLTSSVATSSHTITLNTPTVSWSAIPAADGGGRRATITCANVQGATFYYTTNGTTPTTSSSSKTVASTSNSITIDFQSVGSYTIVAYAVKSGYLDSAKYTGSAEAVAKLATPVISKTAIAGGYSVLFECNKDTAGAAVASIAIHYKNGSSVAVTDASISHNGTVSCTPSSQTPYTYRAIATKDNYINSDPATPLTFTIYKLQAPKWSSFTDVENGKSVTITAYSAYVNGTSNTGVTGVATSYTAPTKTETLSGAKTATQSWTGTAYPSGKTLTATSSLDGYISATATTTLTLYKLSTPTVGTTSNATPGKQATLTCNTYITASGTASVSGVKCHYTTDGTTAPSSSSPSVNSGANAVVTSAGTYTFKARGILAGYVSSDVATGSSFTILQLDPPSIAKEAKIGGYDVTYTSVNGYTLRYSLDGGKNYSSTTIGSTGTYPQSLRPADQTSYTIWAVNRASGYADSTPAKHAAFTIYKLTDPKVDAPEDIAGGKSVKLTCTTDTAGHTVPGVNCYYTTDDSTAPTTSGSSKTSGSSVTLTPPSQSTYAVWSLAALAGYITSGVTKGSAFTVYKLSKPGIGTATDITAGKQVVFTCTTDTAGNTVSGVTVAVTSSPTTGVSATSVSSGGAITYKPSSQTTYTISAIAKKNGYIDSASESDSVTVYQLAKPSISRKDIVGGKQLTFTCTKDTAGNSVSGITIRYTNGTATVSTSTTKSTGGTLDVTSAGSYSYTALATKDGYANSGLSDANAFTLYRLSKPTSAISDTTNGKNLTWTNATTYIDGSTTKTVSGITLVYQNEVSGTSTDKTTAATAVVSFTGATFSNVTRTASCQLSGYATSETATSAGVTVYQLAMPTIGDPEDYVGGKKVTLFCTKDTANNTVSGITFRYTTNASTPTTSSSSTNPILLDKANSYTIWAMATKNGYMHSAVAKDEAITVYKLTLTYSTSSISNAAGTGTVTVISKVNGSNVNATIYYDSKTSGTAAATTSSSFATGSKSWTSQSHGNTFSAVATLSGYEGSSKTDYQLNVTPIAPTITITQPDSDKTVRFEITKNNTDNATSIYYSYTGTASKNSTLYSSAVTNFGADPSAVATVYACTVRTANNLSSSAATTSKSLSATIIGDPTSGSAWMLAADTSSTSVIGTL